MWVGWKEDKASGTGCDKGGKLTCIRKKQTNIQKKPPLAEKGWWEDWNSEMFGGNELKGLYSGMKNCMY